ncbi:23S rRNA (pseudouridine(1915)-N(3))-methyltransferase RlmH [Prosthecobacter sp.]|uniref:23S rRNA (pseudouridine(1915)-N(3))-methyltransferase RlmH n=1 Tax=Prosthecobacter sp. TaxID=1965333 RepID=UPI001D29E649|nr:23S rRNA (pseudouridine(1915)-N(3))-methyltransferase RlmH [Prosthecobacter sp.]MCB1275978.1 23S rRNA (pseudouridine(1915)-N(3))-methyltransferase RlmH [Prosthecobacter sp.]
MQWRIITVGKPGHSWVKEAMSLYWDRLQHYGRFEHVVIKEAPRERMESQIDNACAGDLCVLLDERGKQLRSLELARWIEGEEVSGRKRICLVIGGADGHSPRFRSKATVCWSLSTLTMQHDIALVVLIEQIYRAYTIMRGEPYHRE